MSGDLARMHINLTPRSAVALQRIMAVTGDNQTVVVNRAIRIYALALEHIDNEGRLQVGSETVVLL